jgi:hypothetical protein
VSRESRVLNCLLADTLGLTEVGLHDKLKFFSVVLDEASQQ